MRAETDRALLQAVSDNLVETGKGTAANEQDVGRVDLQELLLRMLAATLRRNGAVVPSISLSSACCTPSPDTSRVIEGFPPCG